MTSQFKFLNNVIKNNQEILDKWLLSGLIHNPTSPLLMARVLEHCESMGFNFVPCSSSRTNVFIMPIMYRVFMDKRTEYSDQYIIGKINQAYLHILSYDQFVGNGVDDIEAYFCSHVGDLINWNEELL